MSKLLLLLETDEPDALEELLCARAPGVFIDEQHLTLQIMREVAGDVFYDPASPHARPQIVLELVVSPGRPLLDTRDLLAELLQDATLRQSSLALVMQERVYIDCAPQAVHYHYLMLKRAGLTVADYNDYYSNYHCRFGFHTPAIEGYSQNYIDMNASDAIAGALKITSREVTSISELKMPSMEAFIQSPAMAELGEPAVADEERFVDRDNSVAFCSRVVLRHGDFATVREARFEQYFTD